MIRSIHCYVRLSVQPALVHHRTGVGAGDQRGILSQSRQAGLSQRLPPFPAPGKFFIGYVDGQTAIGNIDMNRIAVPDKSDGTAGGGFRADVADAGAVALMLIGMPISGSIGHAIGLGLISYTIMKIFGGKAKEVSILTYIISALFLVKFFLAV